MTFFKLLPILGIFLPILVMADTSHLRSYENAMILKPYIVRDGTRIYADKNHWLTLPWSQFVAIGSDRLLFKHEGVIVTCPMEGHICDQEYTPQEEE